MQGSTPEHPPAPAARRRRRNGRIQGSSSLSSRERERERATPLGAGLPTLLERPGKQAVGPFLVFFVVFWWTQRRVWRWLPSLFLLRTACLVENWMCAASETTNNFPKHS